MYFIAEGEVAIMGSDKTTVISYLGKGSYFGEISILIPGIKRTSFVVAESYCTICSLKKKEVDSCAEMFPSISKKLQVCAQKRLLANMDKERQNVVSGNKSTSVSPHVSPSFNMNPEEPQFSTPQLKGRDLFNFTGQPKQGHGRMSFQKGFRRSSSLMPDNDRRLTVTSLVGGRPLGDRSASPNTFSRIRASILQNKTSPGKKMIPTPDIKLPKRMSILRQLHTIELTQENSPSKSSAYRREMKGEEEKEGNGLNMALDMVGNKIVIEEEEDDTNLRRQQKGIHERRLSRLTLGKNLTLSETAGLELQWTISIHRKEK